jgi:Ni/Co efflux regulator RcnB
MKMITLVSAGLIALAATAPIAVSAQDRPAASTQDRQAHHERVVTHTRVVHDNGRHAVARKHHVRRVCRMEWRHHHRVRICRNKRW